MIGTATYRVELRLATAANGSTTVIVNDIRPLCQNLTWTIKRTKEGVGSIDFTVNDVLLDEWLRARSSYGLNDILRPYALRCIVYRGTTAVAGGFLATMPAYQPRGTSADLKMRFDDYLNIYAGVYIYDSATGLPRGTMTGALNTTIRTVVTEARNRALAAGKQLTYGAFGTVNTLPSVTQTFDIYKSVKDFIVDRCDNTDGAGPFDVTFEPINGSMSIYADANFGTVITDWVAHYPADIDSESATSISAREVSGFASKILAIGNGELSADSNVNTALLDNVQDNDAVVDYGYVEAVLQRSDISRAANLRTQALAELYNSSTPTWQPQITLTGRQVNPVPTGSKKIWIGDTITIQNDEDLTGQTSGQFRVNAIRVEVSATNAETITPTLEARTSSRSGTLAQQAGAVAREVNALKQAHEHGLGMIDFFTETETATLQPNMNHRVTLSFSSDYPMPPFVEVGISPRGDDLVVLSEVFDEVTQTYNVMFQIFDTMTVTATATSSAQITSMVLA